MVFPFLFDAARRGEAARAPFIGLNTGGWCCAFADIFLADGCWHPLKGVRTVRLLRP